MSAIVAAPRRGQEVSRIQRVTAADTEPHEGRTPRHTDCYAAGVSGPSQKAQPGLCGDCVNARRIESDRGSVFILCELSFRDPRFAKYPRLPVLSCSGYAQASSVKQGSGG